MVSISSSYAMNSSSQTLKLICLLIKTFTVSFAETENVTSDSSKDKIIVAEIIFFVIIAPF